MCRGEGISIEFQQRLVQMSAIWPPEILPGEKFSFLSWRFESDVASHAVGLTVLALPAAPEDLVGDVRPARASTP